VEDLEAEPHRSKKEKKMSKLINLENINDLKLFAYSYVLEHDLSKEDTKNLFDYIKEADEEHVKHLLLTGIPVTLTEKVGSYQPDSLTHWKDIGRAIIDKGYTKGLSTGRLQGFAAAAIAALAGVAIAKIWKNYMSKAAKACKDKSGPEKKNCMTKFKQEAVKKQIAELNSLKAKCSQSKSPTDCKAKIDKKLMGLKARLGAL